MTELSPDFVPDWAKGIVWYQIFPERFCNGDRSNDPRLDDQQGAYPHDMALPWQVHPWMSDWYELQPYERANGRELWHILQRRRYGGDLQGILDRLDYLQDLGVGGLYLTPVFASPSSHKYDGATYHHVDPNFGPDPDGDRALMDAELPGAGPADWVWTAADRLLLRLIEEVHRRGMRIILDGVFNHMGISSWAFRDARRNRQNSPFQHWFVIDSRGDAQTGEGFRYQGWEGVQELPQLRQDETGIVAGPREYIFQATRRWMDPDGDGDPRDGIDGWRLDVAIYVAHPFWKAWRRHVKAINPDAYLTGELFGTKEEILGYLRGDEFDAAMNYPFAYACAEYFIQSQHRIDTRQFDRQLRELREAYPACVTQVMQNLFGSHDTNRMASHIVNRELANFRNWADYHCWSTVRNNPSYDTRKPTEEERRLQKLFVLFQMTYIGAPMVYFGDEAGMWGANDPCCRKPMVWPEHSYAAEEYEPNGGRRATTDTVAFDHELFELYRRLIHLRNTMPALKHGDFTTVLADGDRDVYVFRRSCSIQTVLVALNRGDQPHRVVLSANQEAANYLDLLNDREIVQVDRGELVLTVGALWGRILLSDSSEAAQASGTEQSIQRHANGAGSTNPLSDEDVAGT